MFSNAAAGNVARHYSERRGQTLQERKRSDIFLLRELNNWVKAVLIRELTPRGAFVLDLACGKGGDLPKWKEAGVGAYCGIDIALESVRTDARLRYNVGQHAFPAALFVGDCFEAPLPLPLQPFGPFDVVSCQFALHYSFGTEARARRALQNVAALLRTGGVFLGTTADADVLVRKLRATHGLRFGNDLYGVEFDARHAAKTFSADAPFGLEYRFTLADAVDDVAEYLVHLPTLKRLAEECGLRLTHWSNFHKFVHERLQVKRVHDRQLWISRCLGGVRDEDTGVALPPPRCALSEEEWEVANLYAVFAFEKFETVGDEGQVQQQQQARHTPTRADPGPWKWSIDRSDVRAVDTAGCVVALP